MFQYGFLVIWILCGLTRISLAAFSDPWLWVRRDSLEVPHVSANFQRLYGLPELQTSEVNFTLGGKAGLSGGVRSFGWRLYTEQSAFLEGAWRAGENWRLTFSGVLLRLQVEKRRHLGGNLRCGIQWHNGSWNLGWSVRNVLPPSCGESFRSVFSLRWRDRKWWWRGFWDELEDSPGYPGILVGMALDRRLAGEMGWLGRGGRLAWSLTLNWEEWQCRLRGFWHSGLGWSQRWELSWYY
jgi:hypothetical protein